MGTNGVFPEEEESLGDGRGKWLDGDESGLLSPWYGGSLLLVSRRVHGRKIVIQRQRIDAETFNRQVEFTVGCWGIFTNCMGSISFVCG